MLVYWDMLEQRHGIIRPLQMTPNKNLITTITPWLKIYVTTWEIVSNIEAKGPTIYQDIFIAGRRANHQPGCQKKIYVIESSNHSLISGANSSQNPTLPFTISLGYDSLPFGLHKG